MTSPADPASLEASRLFGVPGMVAVVTGGGTGIGLMITRALVANGAAKVYILGRRLEKLTEAASLLNDPSSSSDDVVVPLVCDVTSVDALQSAASRIAASSGFVNLVVCNSGIAGPLGVRATPGTTLDDFVAANLAADPQSYNDTFAVNVGAVWYTAMAFLPLLAAGNNRGGTSLPQQKSQVVAVSSIAAFNKANTGGFAYAQSKAACLHLVKQLSVVLPRWDLRANAICPGIYPSDMSASIVSTNEGSPVPKDQIPVGFVGNEQDMAGAILYLASRAGAYCNGTVVVTDGGRLTTFPTTF